MNEFLQALQTTYPFFYTLVQISIVALVVGAALVLWLAFVVPFLFRSLIFVGRVIIGLGLLAVGTLAIGLLTVGAFLAQFFGRRTRPAAVKKPPANPPQTSGQMQPVNQSKKQVELLPAGAKNPGMQSIDPKWKEKIQ